MVDANQAWTVSEAKLMLHELMPYDLAWLEEPIVADRPDTEWLSLAKTSDIPLAGGENIFSEIILKSFKQDLKTAFPFLAPIYRFIRHEPIRFIKQPLQVLKDYFPILIKIKSFVKRN